MMSGGYWLAIHKCNIEIIINFFRQPASLPNVIGQFEPEITEYTVVCQQTALENPIRIEVMSFVTVPVFKIKSVLFVDRGLANHGKQPHT